MDALRWIAVALSTILGLSIARILSGYVAAFKLRRDVRLDWLPLVFAGVVLGEALQFWWALGELIGRDAWRLADFMLLVSLVILLYLAAALILPTDSEATSRHDVFERDGRWALMVLGAFHATAIVANARLWSQPVLSWESGLTGLIAVSCVAAAVSRRRAVQRGVAIIYCALTLVGMVVSSPTVFGPSAN